MDKIYDRSDNVIADWQATGQMQGGWSVGYLYLMGRLGALFENSTTYFVGTDHLGSTRGLVDTSGNIIDAYHYLPFGELLQGSTYTAHKFTGFERDPETGLDNARARYHASWMGRFLSLDPHNAGAIVTSPQTWNAYVYVSDNPLTLIDPTGMVMSGGGDFDNQGYGPASLPYNRGLQVSMTVFLETLSVNDVLQTGQQKPAPKPTPPSTGQRHNQKAPKNSRTDLVLYGANSGKPIRGTTLLWEKDWKIASCQNNNCAEDSNAASHTVSLEEQTNGTGPWKSGGEEKGGFQDEISPEARTITQQFSIDNQRVQVVLGRDDQGKLIFTWDVKIVVHGIKSSEPPTYAPDH